MAVHCEREHKQFEETDPVKFWSPLHSALIEPKIRSGAQLTCGGALISYVHGRTGRTEPALARGAGPVHIMESELLKVLLIAGDGRLAQAVAEKLRAQKDNPLKSPPCRRWMPAWPGCRPIRLMSFCSNFPRRTPPACFRSPSSPPRRRPCRWWFWARARMKRSPWKSFAPARRSILPRSNLGERALEPVIRCALERQLEQAALLKEKENYYGMFDHLVEGIFRTTPDGHYLLANVALARIYGYDSPVELMASIKDIGRSLYVEPAPARGVRPVDANQRHHHRLRIADLPQGRVRSSGFRKIAGPSATRRANCFTTKARSRTSPSAGRRR